MKPLRRRLVAVRVVFLGLVVAAAPAKTNATDDEELLGPQCAALLSSQRKLEREALASFGRAGFEAKLAALTKH